MRAESKSGKIRKLGDSSHPRYLLRFFLRAGFSPRTFAAAISESDIGFLSASAKENGFLSALLREAGEIFLDSSAAKDFTCAEKAFLALFAGAAGAGQPPSRPSAAAARRLSRFFV